MCMSCFAAVVALHWVKVKRCTIYKVKYRVTKLSIEAQVDTKNYSKNQYYSQKNQIWQNWIKICIFETEYSKNVFKPGQILHLFFWLQGVSWLKVGGKDTLHKVRRLDKITGFSYIYPLYLMEPNLQLLDSRSFIKIRHRRFRWYQGMFFPLCTKSFTVVIISHYLCLLIE